MGRAREDRLLPGVPVCEGAVVSQEDRNVMVDQQRLDGGLRELALFAGAGGGILGGKLLGWRTVCAVERDAYAASVLAQRQNDGILKPFPIWSDVETFDGRPWRGLVDVVSAGFPCQDISVAGKGAGLDGAKSGLWREVVRIVRDVQPRYVFVENSPNLLNLGFGAILADLAALGFDARWGVLGAVDAGAPHSRDRVWIVADSKRGEEQQESRQRVDRGVGRQRQSVPWNTTPECALSFFRGVDDGVARNVDRTNATRNGQVPAVAALAWRILGGE